MVLIGTSLKTFLLLNNELRSSKVLDGEPQRSKQRNLIEGGSSLPFSDNELAQFANSLDARNEPIRHGLQVIARFSPQRFAPIAERDTVSIDARIDLPCRRPAGADRIGMSAR